MRILLLLTLALYGCDNHAPRAPMSYLSETRTLADGTVIERFYAGPVLPAGLHQETP